MMAIDLDLAFYTHCPYCPLINNHQFTVFYFYCRLPSFTSEQKRLLKGTADFLALNFYSVSFAEYHDLSKEENFTWGYFTDQEMKTSRDPTWLKG